MALTSSILKFDKGEFISRHQDFANVVVRALVVPHDAEFSSLCVQASAGDDWYDVIGCHDIPCAEPGWYPVALDVILMRLVAYDGNGRPMHLENDCEVLAIREPR